MRMIKSVSLIGLAILAQACGSSNSSSTPQAASVASGGTQSCGYNSAGVYTCSSSSTTNTGAVALYSACGSSSPNATALNALYQQGISNASVQSVTSQTSADGVAVCEVLYTQTVTYNTSRVFLGPNAGNSYHGGNSGVSLQAYDQFAAKASGCYSASSSCSIAITDIATNASDTGSNDLFGEIVGGNYGSYFPIYGQVQALSSTGGALNVGVNQGSGTSGVLDFSLEVQIQRCVDSNGYVNQCPNVMTSTL